MKNEKLKNNMKKTFVSMVVMFFVIFCKSQNYDDGRSMSPILENTIKIMEFVEGEGAEIVRVEMDILHDEKVTYRILQEGWTYLIFAYGDYRVSDIDIEVYKETGSGWSLIKKDNSADPTALVEIEPYVSGNYAIKVKGYRCHTGYNSCHYGLIICHE